MKKNLLSILLALVLVLGLTVLAAPAVSAEEETETAAHSHCYCVNAEYVPEDHVCEENVTWEDLSTATIADGGHYYLTKNTAKSITVKTAINVTICLNGYNLYAQKALTVYGGGVVNICNCQSAGRLYSSRDASKTGYALMISSSSAAIGTVNLWSGNISGASNNSTHCRAVEVKGGVFNMYGGQVINGWAGYDATLDTVKFGYGGNVCVYNNAGNTAKFTMYGGTVTGGQASINGGNIYVEGGVFTLNGGTVTGGNNSGVPTEDAPLVGMGGNVFVTSTGAVGTVVINGGTIENGQAYNGGNIAGDGQNVTGSTGKKVDIKLNNGIITGGTATNGGGNIYLHNTTNGSVMHMTGGTITAGKAANGGNVYVDGNNPTTQMTAGIISDGEASGNGGNIYVDAGAGKTWTLSGVTVSGGTAGKTVTEGTDAETGEVTTTTSYTGNGGSIYVGSGTLNITTGTVSGGIAKNGGNIYIDDGGKEATNAVHVTNSTVTGGKAQYGGNIYTKDELYIEAGAIISNGFAAKAGGNIRIDGTGSKLDMSAGTISGGNAGETGGNINSLDCTNVSITGGTIENGTAGQGGNLYIVHTSLVATRKLTISNATITGGNATAGNGGNLYISRVGQVTLTDVTMTDGVATESGSNIYAQMIHNLNISGGTYSVAAGNRNYTYDAAKHTKYTQEEIETYGLNVAGTRISGNGGNICISSISGITTSTTSTDENGQEVTTETTTPGSGTITGATILGGNAVNGGALYISSGAVTLDGITAKSCGGESGRVLHIAKNATVTLKDSTMVNWGTKGTALTNKGTLILVGTINLNKEYSAAELKAQANGTDPNVTLDIVVDCVDNADAVLDITGLTAVDEAITVNRLGTEDADGKHTEPGLVAIGANETNAAMLVCSHAAYKLVQDGTNINLVAKAVWGMNGTDAVIGYESLAEIAEGDGVTWYALNVDLEGQSIGKGIVLDLCGNDLSAEIADGVVVSLIDSANDKYDAAACGKLTVTGNGKTAPIVHTTVDQGGAVKHYVTLKNEDGTYSAHRYVAAVVKMSLKPAADALGYKASFSADSVARAAMKNYGISVWVNEDHKISNAKDGAISDNSTPLTLRVKNILAAGGGETTVYGDAFITFVVDGQEIVANTSVKNTSMKSFIETMEKEMEAGTATYTAEQITAVQELLNKYESKVSGWNIDSILNWTAEPEATEPEETTEPAA